MGLLAVGDDATGMRDLARPMLALYVGGMGAKGRNFYNDLARRFGYEAEAEKIQDLYLDGRKDEAAAAVPPGLLEAATICGPEGYVRDRIAAYRDTGVTVLNVTPIAADIPALVGLLKEWIGDERSVPEGERASGARAARPKTESGKHGDGARLRHPRPATDEVLACRPEHGPDDVAAAVALSPSGVQGLEHPGLRPPPRPRAGGAGPADRPDRPGRRRHL